MDLSRISQFSAIAASAANSTALRFKTGSAPGRPRQTGQTFVFGGSPKRVEQEQKILLLVSNWTCTSSPMTGSYFARAAARLSTDVAMITKIIEDGKTISSGTWQTRTGRQTGRPG